MSLISHIEDSMGSIRGTIQIAIWIYESEKSHADLKETAKRLSINLNVIGGVLEQLKQYAHRIAVSDEHFLIGSIDALKPVLEDAQSVMRTIQHNRNFIQRLLMNAKEYEQKLQAIIKQLYDLCAVTQRTINTLPRIQIHHREFLDFRETFANISEKELSFYDFSIVEDISPTILKLTFGTFDTMSSLCYIKQSNERFFLSYQLRTWSALDITLLALAQRRRRFAQNWHNKSDSSLTDSDPSLNKISSKHSLPTVAAENNTHKKLDFSEFFMSHDNICGMTFTKSCIYIATKYEIIVISSSKQKIIAQHGIEGDGPNTFRHISYIYIPPNDEKNLYIVDRGQNAVHYYEIDDSGLHFQFKQQYIIIAHVAETYNLVSCAIFDGHLYVSDDGNNCLHAFVLKDKRQSFYLSSISKQIFVPGSLCADGEYLYVANCSVENPGVLVFNKQYKLVDYFHNQSLKEILAIDIDPIMHELYILTTTTTVIEDNELKKRPVIVSMDSIVRSIQS